MNTIEIARRLAALGQATEACRAYVLALQGTADPQEQLEAAFYLFQNGGDYKISYTCFRDLYNQGYFRENLLSIMTEAFYRPNVKLLKSRYEKNCKLLAKYPYLFRKDFLSFTDLPIRFFPYDDNGYIPYYVEAERFGDYINPKYPVVSRNFFKNLEKPILADDVYSQYELEYLNDNVRLSEYIGKENHIYLHYTDWGSFCASLQYLNLRPLLNSLKIVFLIENEISLYPIDFQAQFGIDYSQYAIHPVGLREMKRMIWHTQLSAHNGGDFFNEIFDGHPNLIFTNSLMFFSVEESVSHIRETLKNISNHVQLLETFSGWKNIRMVEELWKLKDRTDKDIMITLLVHHSEGSEQNLVSDSRIVPALFFQPHFYHIDYEVKADEHTGQAILCSEQYEQICQSALFRQFKYIKTFTPMRRPTTCCAASTRFMYHIAKLEHASVNDGVFTKILNRSFMVDPQNRLFQDSVLVRFEDGKLNPCATFTALAEFLDLPYTESLTYCSVNGVRDVPSYEGNVQGFDTVSVYRTYDEFMNANERYMLEFLMRDVYEYYDYDFQYYDGKPVDEDRAKELLEGFTTSDSFIREIWEKIIRESMEEAAAGEGEIEEKESLRKIKLQAKEDIKAILDDYIENIHEIRMKTTRMLLNGLRFINQNGQPLEMMPLLRLDPALLEQPLYH